MKTLLNLRRRVPLLTVLAFGVACAVGFGFLWVKGGGSIPLLAESGDYRVVFTTQNVKNVRDFGEVRIAGVPVGRVVDRQVADDSARLELALKPEAAPLHEGATVRVGVKSVVGSSFVDIVDGTGESLESGFELPATAVTPAVDVDELFDAIDPQTRKALSATVRSLGGSTKGTGKDLDRLMTGLGSIGTEGATVVDALAAQSKDLEALSREGIQLLDALDTGRGQIATLVTDARRLTDATAGKREAIEGTMRELPTLLGNVRTAATKLSELSGPLAPVAADLRAAAPDLSAALVQLPAVTDDLHGLLPALDGTLDEAPATLDRVPAFGADVRALVPEVDTVLRDVNPMLAYLQPYGRDLGSVFANFGASMDLLEPNGVRPIRLAAVFNGGSIRGNPLSLPENPVFWTNPYPKPGQAGSPAPFDEKYLRLHREPK